MRLKSIRIPPMFNENETQIVFAIDRHLVIDAPWFGSRSPNMLQSQTAHLRAIFGAGFGAADHNYHERYSLS